ncbi:tetratricopeptide repeat protein [Ralstonia pseudosolanacearum]
MNKQKIDLSVFCMRARNLLAKGDADNALALYGDVLQVDSDNSLAYADRGTAYAMLKKFDSALADLKQAIALGYVDASVYCTIGTVYSELGQLEVALDCLNKAIDMSKVYPLAYYNRSSVLHGLGDDGAAISDLERCLEFDPDEGVRQLILGRLNLLRSSC